jgi:hypothetical protein
MISLRFYTTLVVTMLISVALGGAGLAVRPALAATCRAGQCDGEWPGEQGCLADQQVVASFIMSPIDTGPGTVYRSRTCHATWAEFDFDQDPSGIPFLVLQLWMQKPYGSLERILRRGDGAHFIKVTGTTDVYRTVMLSWDYSVKACFYDRFTTGPDYDPDPESIGNQEIGGCTGWR